MPTIPIEKQEDREFLEDAQELLGAFATLAARRRSYAAQVAADGAALATLAARIRRALGRYRPELAAALGAPLVDLAILRTSEGVIEAILTNAEAQAAREVTQ